MKQGHAADLIAIMQTLVQQSSGERQKTLAREYKYFTTGQQQGRLNYSQVAAIKLPIGTGAIESLIRQVVNLRLKGTGKFWLLEHAEVMLHARCQWAAGVWAWTNFCDSIVTACLYPA